MSANVGQQLRVVMLSYWVTEESGGPGIAAAGFAAGLARRGAEVLLVARDDPRGRWLVDEDSARAAGFRLRRLPRRGWLGQVRELAGVLGAEAARPGRTVVWVNGIWGPQSLAAYLGSGRGRLPYVVRPAGSLGLAALGHKRLKKRLYYAAVESRVMAAARAVHCLSAHEVAELPVDLRSRAFVVPSGVDLPDGPLPRREPLLVGVLARLHPIKNHGQVLDAVEALAQRGVALELELAGSTSDAATEAALRARVAASPHLSGRVRFLGHVEKRRLPEVVGRWRAALLLSEQENFGHAVIAAAALGVPTLASPGVGLAADLHQAGAGLLVAPGEAAEALLRVLEGDEAAQAERCRRFAGRYAWDQAAADLLQRLDAVAGPV